MTVSEESLGLGAAFGKWLVLYVVAVPASFVTTCLAYLIAGLISWAVGRTWGTGGLTVRRLVHGLFGCLVAGTYTWTFTWLVDWWAGGLDRTDWITVLQNGLLSLPIWLAVLYRLGVLNGEGLAFWIGFGVCYGAVLLADLYLAD